MALEVTVLGAGIVGLSTALQIQEKYRDARVTLVAELFNTNTTSDGAAGIFRPGTSFSVGSEDKTEQVLLDSYYVYNELLHKFSPQMTGVSEVSGYLFSNTSESIVRNPLIENVVPVYRRATEEELTLCPGTWKYGSYFSTILTECRRLLPFYLKRFVENNGTVIQRKIVSASQLESLKFDVLFNCMGMGAKEVFNDRKLVPIRGQVLKVSAPWLKNFFYSDYDTYIIPGIDNVTLGGCRNYDSYDLNSSRHDSAGIMERCCSLVPKLKTAQIERTWVGLRPHRDTVRIQPESFVVNGKKLKIIHNYGHGGYGVTAAPGSAKLAVSHFEKTHRASKL